MKRKKWGVICFLIGCMSVMVGFKHEPVKWDFPFLKECTQISGIWLKGERSDGEPSVTPDLEFLPNAVTVEFYGEKIR